MKIRKPVGRTNNIPIISCSMFVLFTDHIKALAFSDWVKRLGGSSDLRVCKSTEEISVRIAHIHAVRQWEFADALNDMFFQIKDKYDEIKEAIATMGASCYIDIVCYKKDVYPAMLFEGEAMRIIHDFKADISIDMYDE